MHVRLDLIQPISNLSYDHLVLKIWKILLELQWDAIREDSTIKTCHLILRVEQEKHRKTRLVFSFFFHCKSTSLSLYDGTHKLMLMIPESQYLKDKRTFRILTLYFML